MSRNFPSVVPGRQPIFRLLALASLVAAGCGGEQAFRARDGGAAGVGGATAGSAGRGGSTAGIGGSVTGGTGGSAGAGAGGGTSGTGGVGATGGAGGRGGGAAGRGGTGGSGGTGGRATGPLTNGTSCTADNQCMSSWCVDGVCCINSCTGTCMRCNAPSGNCQFIADLSDPDDECTMEDASTCGNTGDCNGAGACRKYGTATVCDSTPSCSGGSIVMTKTCNGIGGPNSCVPKDTQSCNGFLCVAGPSAACGTSCSADSDCASKAFCGAATCVATPNIAGNGNLEYGSSLLWQATNGSTVGTTTTGPHGGTYAVSDTARTALFMGPGYALPTGQGIYNVNVWAQQIDPNWPTLTGVLQVRIVCKDQSTVYYPFVVQAQTLMPGTWTLLSGSVDTRVGVGADCAPANSGLVRSAVLYLNQAQTETCTGPSGGGPVCPDLYMDDLVVNVTDGHNLIGNPNFEAGAADGWGVSSGMASQAVVTTFAHLGTHSLRQYSRQTPATGPRWLLPTGYGRYNVSLWVMQNGLVAHDLTLMSTYTCQGSSAQMLPAGTTMQGVIPGSWTQLSGTVTVPPPNAPAGCKLTNAAVYVMQEGTTCGTGASQVECPDLYVDDASITMPMP